VMFRTLLSIASRVGRPGTLLRLGDSDGRVLYLEAAMSPVSVVVGLERDDVRRLHATLSGWLAEREDSPLPLRGPAPLVAGRIRRGLADASRVDAGAAHDGSALTVQFCTEDPPAV
jgi:hypothetical protein